MGGLKKDGRHKAFPQRSISFAGNFALSGIRMESGGGWLDEWMNDDIPAQHTSYRLKCYF